MKQLLYQRLAGLVRAYGNCLNSANTEWESKHKDTIEELVKNHMPSGSGIDCGTKLDLDASLRADGNKLYFTFSFHHMNENGYYCGWSDYRAIVSADLQSGFKLKITGRDINDIKSYLYDTFSYALEKEIEY